MIYTTVDGKKIRSSSSWKRLREPNDWFYYDREKYRLSDFEPLSYPIMYYDENDKIDVIGYIQKGWYAEPLLLQMDGNGEGWVRVFTEMEESED